MSLHPGKLVVDLNALAHNISQLRAHLDQHLPNKPQAMAVVKANAYGHGLVQVAATSVENGCTWLGVAQAQEALDLAISLEKRGVSAPLDSNEKASAKAPRILTWMWNPGADISPLLEHRIDISVGSKQALIDVRAAVEKTGKTARIQLELDTAMSRGGVSLDDACALLRRALDTPGIEVHGIWSHLACADLPTPLGRELTEAQTSQIKNIAQIAKAQAIAKHQEKFGKDAELDWVTHLGATSGALWYPDEYFDLYRLGIGMYGLSPNEQMTSSADLGIKTVGVLSAKIIVTHDVPAGTGVSYGHTYHTARDTRIATVGLGYADGIPRLASNRAEVWINGKRYPVRGRICMDQFMVEVDKDVQTGDTCVIWGDPQLGHPSADEWATWAQTISYECLVSVGERVARIYKK